MERRKITGGEKMSDLIGSTYEVMEEIGSGGSGRVYLAKHLRLGKNVVLKAYNQKINAHPELLSREVDILKELNHPYIPRVYDFFTEGETTYTVMDYIEGESLDRPLKRGEKFSQPQVIEWAKQLLDALCYLHSSMHGSPPRGFVHSDIKPANVMRTSNNKICLIDFNIALALGEENVIGCSSGYASPEHYGLDYSSENTTSSKTSKKDRKTVLVGGRATVIPDVRSDIYSTGATLYHLLSGRRPSGDAKKVIPLSEKEYSSPLVRIISKAMNPNPDLRYQTAEEMLRDFVQLRENDPRVKHYKRNNRIVYFVISTLLVTGALSAFVGLKRMETTENWLKLAEYSKSALAEGQPVQAILYALQALPIKTKSLLQPAYTAEAQRALAAALNVYDLSDGYKMHQMVELPSAPLSMDLSPDGMTAACVYNGFVAVFDMDSAKMLAVLPAASSALAEVQYLDDSILLYSGSEGLKAYHIEMGMELWTGRPATTIAISGDGKRVAAVYKDENFAIVYNTLDGEMVQKIDFGQKYQSVTVNDSFANPEDNLLALNEDGTMLGISFADGSLQIYNLSDPERDMLLFDETSGYVHFEGGFYQQYFAFSATGADSSVFAVIDTEEMEQTGGYESESSFGVQTDGNGIYVQTENILVKIHPVTGEQTPLVTTAETILRFARSSSHTLITSQKECLFFDRNANLIAKYEKENGSELIQMAEGKVIIGSRDTPVLRIMKFESFSNAEIFSYPLSEKHDEARVSADGSTIMLFSYQKFDLYNKDGKLLKEVLIPNADQVYDQQYRRENGLSWLEVIYNNGAVVAYSAADGSLLWEKMEEKPNLDLYEEFFTDKLRIESPLHGTPAAYNRKTGQLVRKLEEDAYLTYVTQVGEHIVVQYVTADGYCFGQLLNEKCEVLADLPYLCDIVEETLIFDYPTGNMRETRIYDIEELIDMAQNKTMGGNETWKDSKEK